MNIEINNLKVFEYEPYRKYVYTADLYIEGQMASKVTNDGKRTGIAAYYDFLLGGRALVERAKRHCRKLPSKTLYLDDELPTVVKSNLATHIEDLIIEQYDLTKPQRDKLELGKRMKKGLVYGHPNQPVESYRLLYIRETPLEYVLKSDHLKESFREFISPLIRGIRKDGMVIFNTNVSREDAQFLRIEDLLLSSQKTEAPRRIPEKKAGARQPFIALVVPVPGSGGCPSGILAGLAFECVPIFTNMSKTVTYIGNINIDMTFARWA